MGCAIVVKKEVNYRVLPPNANEDSHPSLLCPEMLLGSSRLKSSAPTADGNKNMKSSDATEQSATSNSESTTESSTDEESKSPLPPLLSPIRSPPEEVWSSPATQMRPEEETSLGLFDPREKDDVEEEEEDEEDEEREGEGGAEEEMPEEEREGGGEDDEEEARTEAEKSGDEKSSVVSSEKEPSPVSSTTTTTAAIAVVCQLKEVVGEGANGERSREKRKRVRETEEEYAMRRMARRESLKFAIDFCESSLFFS